MSEESIFGEVIHAYTRAQALEDGVLVDMTEWARETGFMVPVAATQSLWADINAIPRKGYGAEGDVRGRAHDVLWMLFCAIRGSRPGARRISYQLIMPTEGTRRRYKTLIADYGPGDDGAPVITIGYAEDF